MANLQGKKISNTYEGLIKTENNSAVAGTTVLTDGAGQSLQITVNTDGTLTAQTINANNLNISNWDTAYSWGDHSLAGYATSSEIADAVNNVINSAPAALDTLDELAAALNDDANFATTITNLITGVSDRVTTLENNNSGVNTGDQDISGISTNANAISTLQGEVDLNTAKTGITAQQAADIEANNAKTGITAQQASEITANTAKVGITTAQASEIAANTLKTGITAQQASDISTNNSKVGITTAQSDAIIANTAKNSYPSADATKLAGIEAGAQVNPVNVSELNNDAGYVTENTQLSDAEIAALGYIKTDTNTQLSDADIAAFGYIKTDTNTQRTDAEINALIDANTNGYITDYTVTEADVTAHQAALTISESQISDLSHFSGSYNDLTDKPVGVNPRTDEEIQDVVGATISGSGATSVTYDDVANTITVNSTDTNTQLSDADIAAMGYIKTDTNTQLSDADIAAFGYIKTDTNTQRTDEEIQDVVGGLISGSGATTVTYDDVAGTMTVSSTDTNTQRTDSEINALIATGVSGLASETYVDTAVSNLVDAAPTTLDTLNELAAALGDDPNFATTVSTNIGNVSNRVTTLENAGYITDYTVTEGDVTAHQAALSITESQISDLSHFSGSYNDLTDKPAGVNPRTDEEIQDIVGTMLSGSGATSVAYDDAAGTISISSTDTDTNTQRTDEEIQDVIGGIISGSGATTVSYDDVANTITVSSTDTNTQLSDSDIAAFGYIKTDTNTQRTDAEINALIDANTNGYITDYTVTQGDVTAHQAALTITESQISDLSHFSGSYNDLTDVPAGVTARTDEEIEDVVGSLISGTGATTVTYNDAAGTLVVSSTDTNTQLSDADIAAMGYIKTDTNTQLTDAEIAAFGYIKTDTNTQRTDEEIQDVVGTAISGSGATSVTYNDAAGTITVSSTDTNTQLSDGDIAAFGYTKGNETVTLSGDITGSGTTAITASIASNAVGADELNVSGNGTSGQVLASDGDGSFSWTDVSGGIGGSIANTQIAFGNGTDSLAGDADFTFASKTLTLGGDSGSGNLVAQLITGEALTSNNYINVANYIQHQSDTNTKFGFPANDTFTIETSGSERMRVDSSGNVGISEVTPETLLHVTKNTNSHSWSHNSNVLATFENSASAYVNIVAGNSNQAELWFSDSALSGRGRLRYDHSSDTMEIWGASAPKAYIYSTGNMTITGTLSENSDERLKENINTIENALDKVNNLRGVEYNMIADDSKTKKLGLIAQEVEAVVPELVHDNAEYKSVAYSTTVALLVESIKELTDKVNDLQSQIDTMRA